MTAFDKSHYAYLAGIKAGREEAVGVADRRADHACECGHRGAWPLSQVLLCVVTSKIIAQAIRALPDPSPEQVRAALEAEPAAAKEITDKMVEAAARAIRGYKIDAGLYGIINWDAEHRQDMIDRTWADEEVLARAALEAAEKVREERS